MSVLEALERLLVELQILVHLVLELGQLHETQLGQIKHLRLAGLVRHFDFGDEKLVKDLKRKKMVKLLSSNLNVKTTDNELC